MYIFCIFCEMWMLNHLMAFLIKTVSDMTFLWNDQNITPILLKQRWKRMNTINSMRINIFKTTPAIFVNHFEFRISNLTWFLIYGENWLWSKEEDQIRNQNWFWTLILTKMMPLRMIAMWNEMSNQWIFRSVL